MEQLKVMEIIDYCMDRILQINRDYKDKVISRDVASKFLKSTVQLVDKTVSMLEADNELKESLTKNIKDLASTIHKEFEISLPGYNY